MTRALGATAALATAGLLTCSAAFAASGPTAKAAPDKNLTNNQSVSVTGKGFTPGATVGIAECNGNVLTGGAAACNDTDIVTATVNKKGDVPATDFKVFTGTVGNGSCGISKATATCYLGVGNTADESQATVVKITFKVTKS